MGLNKMRDDTHFHISHSPSSNILSPSLSLCLFSFCPFVSLSVYFLIYPSSSPSNRHLHLSSSISSRDSHPDIPHSLTSCALLLLTLSSPSGSIFPKVIFHLISSHISSHLTLTLTLTLAASGITSHPTLTHPIPSQSHRLIPAPPPNSLVLDSRSRRCTADCGAEEPPLSHL